MEVPQVPGIWGGVWKKVSPSHRERVWGGAVLPPQKCKKMGCELCILVHSWALVSAKLLLQN